MEILVKELNTKQIILYKSNKYFPDNLSVEKELVQYHNLLDINWIILPVNKKEIKIIEI